MLLLHPPSFSPSLAFVSTILWLVFSHSHSSLSIHVNISVDSISVQCVALTHRPEEWSPLVDAAHLSDQCFSCYHLLVQLHLVSSPPIIAVCAAQGQAASELYWLSLCCFMKHKLPLPGCLHLFPWLGSLPLSLLTLLSHFCKMLCVFSPFWLFCAKGIHTKLHS